MIKKIYVEAKSDHIASISKGSPVSAIEELIWYALDADASEVKVDLIVNSLGAVESVRISDNGSGIDISDISGTFGSLGGSWKRLSNGTQLKKRRLHGRHGRGRFKAFALGSQVEWRTTLFTGDSLQSYVVKGDISSPGEFEVDMIDETGPATGTEVVISNARVCCDALLNTAETVQTLASKFALYLKSYPEVRIYFNGIPVTPVIVQKEVSKYTIKVGEMQEAKLEIIEWKRKFSGSGRIVFTSTDGFELHEIPSGVRTGGASYTAYLVSSRFAALNAENALVMEDLNPEVRAFCDEARKTIKAHFAVVNANTRSDIVAKWIADGSYPYGPDDDSAERSRFDAMLPELQERFDGFAELSSDNRAFVLKLLKKAVSLTKRGGLKTIID
jgi:hypothetical protein